MHRALIKFIRRLILVLPLLSSCAIPTISQSPPKETAIATEIPSAAVLPTSSPAPQRGLTICLRSEPSSLFLYGDSSEAARSVRQAIYDGPFDIRNYDINPVILEKKPMIADGDAAIAPVQVAPGSMIVDSKGNLAPLGDGVEYLPGGCASQACAQIYTGSDPVSMDQLVVQFKMRQDVTWSDGNPLTSDDSVYSFEVAKDLDVRMRPALVDRTQSYQAIDDRTIEWKGLPGYRDPDYAASFFTPLPRHAWGNLSAKDLITNGISSRTPLGWGPYVITEWAPGDHISLVKNNNYFRSSEGLPYFDNLVYRFVGSGDNAINALLAGECDYLDESATQDVSLTKLLELKQAGSASVEFEVGTAWEHIDFGIVSNLDASGNNGNGQPGSAPIFQQKETRQAVAMCIDRQDIANQIFSGQSKVSNTYLPPDHPLYNPEARSYDFDPAAASSLLQSIGWIDEDNNPATPRIAQGVPSVADGTPFEFTYLTSPEPERQLTAQIVQTSLAKCGIKADLSFKDGQELYAPGPDGPIFGRKFSMAQFGWVATQEPACFLYSSGEIPGQYPDFPKGWGGANDTGYSNLVFDSACAQAQTTLPDMPEYKAAHLKAQAIFADDLPAIPLYLHVRVVATRPDLCNVVADASAGNALWNLESFDYGVPCNK